MVVLKGFLIFLGVGMLIGFYYILKDLDTFSKVPNWTLGLSKMLLSFLCIPPFIFRLHKSLVDYFHWRRQIRQYGLRKVLLHKHLNFLSLPPCTTPKVSEWYKALKQYYIDVVSCFFCDVYIPWIIRYLSSFKYANNDIHVLLFHIVSISW